MNVSDVANPHDRFFRQMMSDQRVAKGFLNNYIASGVAEVLDLDRLEMIEATFVDEELREHQGDLLYRVPRRDRPGSALVYVLFEHKSHPYHTTALQVLRYMVSIWERCARQGEELHPILPLVIYHGVQPWNVASNLLDLLRLEPDDPLAEFQPRCEYFLCDLSSLSDDEIKGHILGRVTLLMLKYALRDDLMDQLPRIVQLFPELLRQETGLQYIQTVLRYLCSATDRIDADGLQNLLERTLPAEGGTLMPTLAQQWIEEGRAEGREQGLFEGERRGLLNGIELALKRRFSTEMPRLMDEVRRVEDLELLTRVLDAALDPATSADDIRRLCGGNA